MDIAAQQVQGMVLCITVEFYAILSLLASMLMIINISA